MLNSGPCPTCFIMQKIAIWTSSQTLGSCICDALIWTSIRLSSPLQVKRAIQLRNIVTSLGPAYIKVKHSSCF